MPDQTQFARNPHGVEAVSFLKHMLCDLAGNTWGILRGESPKITRAEAKAGAKLAWEPFYKQGTTLKGDNPPKNST